MKTIKVDDWSEVPNDYTGIAENLDGDKHWYLNGKYHRENGPECVCVDGNKYWFLNGKLHREDGPATEYVSGDKYWYLDGKLHRIDGPACEYVVNEYKIIEYWINGERITKEAQEVLYAMYKLKGML